MRKFLITSVATFGSFVLLNTTAAHARPMDGNGEAVVNTGTATGIGGTYETGVRVPFWERTYDGPFVSAPLSPSGVPQFNLASVTEIPRLKLDVESLVFSQKFKLDSKFEKTLAKSAFQPLDTPTVMSKAQIAALAKIRAAAPASVALLEQAVFKPKGKVSREEFDRIALNQKPETPIALKPGVPLSPDEYKMLSGMLLVQKKGQCPSAIGLFHDLSRKAEYIAEANYYLARCSKELGLITDFFEQTQKVVATQDLHYTRLAFKELGPDVPKELASSFGETMLKASKNDQLMDFGKDISTAGNVYFVLAGSAALGERYQESITYAGKVPQGHAKHQMAQYLLGVSEYASGNKSKALASQEKLLSQLSSTKNTSDFQALVALNLARMYFQEGKFKEAQLTFIKVTKDKPLWLTSLTEMGWSQLQSGDFEGAIGNMYSIQSPFFRNVYKPDSYVIRTIGYLNICQFGDAYRTLSMLEKDYRPWLTKILSFQKEQKPHYQAVKSFLAVNKDQDFEGLPSQVVREMARHKDYINLQTSLNRQIDEKVNYSKLDGQASQNLADAKAMLANTKVKLAQLKVKLGAAKGNPALMSSIDDIEADINIANNDLERYGFQIDLYTIVRGSLASYKKDTVAAADRRMGSVKNKIETVLEKRLVTMKNDLIRILDNNELLRYETFAGSGENIRYQAGGGEKSKRVPASVLPQSKSLSWQFAGEYWEDEIGHYRSTLKNNCPDRQQANLGGAQ